MHFVKGGNGGRENKLILFYNTYQALCRLVPADAVHLYGHGRNYFNVFQQFEKSEVIFETFNVNQTSD